MKKFILKSSLLVSILSMLLLLSCSDDDSFDENNNQPVQVESLEAIPTNQQVTLRWPVLQDTTPRECRTNFLLIQNTDNSPSSHTDGTKIDASFSQLIDNSCVLEIENLTNDITYYFAIYAYDAEKSLYSDGTFASATPFSLFSNYTLQSTLTDKDISANLSKVEVSDDGKIIVVGTENDGIFISTDSGSTWTLKTVTNGLASDAITSLDISSDAATIVAGTDNGLFISTDTGETWVTVTDDMVGIYNSSIIDVALTEDQTKIYVLTHQSLAMSSDGGTTWIEIASHEGNSLLVLNNGEQIYIANYQNKMIGLLVSTDFGDNFSQTNMVESGNSEFNNVSQLWSDGTTVVTVSKNGVSISKDGVTFTNHTIANWPAYYTSNTNAAIAVNIDGTANEVWASAGESLFVSTDGGENWQQQFSSDGFPSTAVADIYFDSSLENMYFATINNGLSFTTDTGFSWTNISAKSCLASNNINKIFASDDGKEIYAATQNGLSISRDGGSTWSVKNSQTTGFNFTDVRSIWVDFSQENTVIHAISEVVYTVSEDGGKTWNPNNFTDHINMITASADGQYVYVIGNRFHRSNDYGVSFTPVDNADMGNAVNLREMWTSAIGDIVLIAADEGCAVSTDYGATWGLDVDSFKKDAPPGHMGINSVWGNKDGTIIYAATYKGLFVSTDKANSWKQIVFSQTDENAPVNAVHTNFDGDYVSVVSGQQLFTTKDFGQTWISYTAADGFAYGSTINIGASSNGDHVYTYDPFSHAGFQYIKLTP